MYVDTAEGAMRLALLTRPWDNLLEAHSLCTVAGETLSQVDTTAMAIKGADTGFMRGPWLFGAI